MYILCIFIGDVVARVGIGCGMGMLDGLAILNVALFAFHELQEAVSAQLEYLLARGAPAPRPSFFLMKRRRPFSLSPLSLSLPAISIIIPNPILAFLAAEAAKT